MPTPPTLMIASQFISLTLGYAAATRVPLHSSEGFA
jgi:hypothetical protein